MPPEPVLVAWSGGKDCALALRATVADPETRVAALLTTVTEEYGRISMHGVRRSLLLAQAASLGLPLVEVGIPADCPNELYEARMRSALDGQVRERGIRGVVFGDLFLEDVRAYRERQLAGTGVRGVFPLWGRATRELARELIDDGFRATVCVVDPRRVHPAFAGRAYDRPLLSDLPADVDPCGENGEFHTFVHDGPIFARPVSFELGVLVERDGFWFRDLVPNGSHDERAAADA